MNNPFFDPNNQSDRMYDSDSVDTNPEQQVSKETKRAVQKLLVILISIGLVIGIVSSVVIVKLMNKYGLTEKTNQLEKIRQ